MTKPSFVLKIFTAVSALAGIIGFVLYIFEVNISLIQPRDLFLGGTVFLLFAFIIDMFDYYDNRIQSLGRSPSFLVEPSLEQTTESKISQLPQSQLDLDLGGDDLKIVRYSIVFLKPGLEHIFSELQEIVDYPTNKEEFARTKALEYFQELQNYYTEQPMAWKNHCPPYPPADSGFLYDNRFLVGLPPEDLKYIRVLYRVDGRYPKLQQ